MAAEKNEKETYYLAGIEGLVEAYNEKTLNILNYRIAKIYLAIGDIRRASYYLEKFIKTGHNEIYQDAAKRMLANINEDDLLLDH